MPDPVSEVTLRRLAGGDEAELLRIHNTPEVMRWWDAPAAGFPWDEPESTRFTVEVGGAVVGLIQYWERGHHRVTIDPATANTAAIRAYEKVGFHRVGIMRKAERDASGEGWHDTLLMELLAGEESPRAAGEGG